MGLTDRIVVDPRVLTGKPVVRGTRISVELVVELLAAGWKHEQILASYPHLSEEDIRACLAYAVNSARRESLSSQDRMKFLADENFSAAGAAGVAEGGLGHILRR